TRFRGSACCAGNGAARSRPLLRRLVRSANGHCSRRPTAPQNRPRVEAGPAEPVDGAVLGDQRGRFAITDERVILDATRHESSSLLGIGSTGVAPMPSLRKATGAPPARSMKLPRAALNMRHVANLQPVADISTGRAMGFPLDAHAIALGARFPNARAL